MATRHRKGRAAPVKKSGPDRAQRHRRIARRHPTPQEIEDAWLALLGVHATMQVLLTGLSKSATIVIRRCALDPLTRAMKLIGEAP